MAPAAVNLLIGKIASLLKNELYLLAGVRDEVKDMRAELQSMKAFLEDADTKQSSNKVENDWIGNVRDVTYKDEDIVDEFIYHMNGQQTGARLTRFLYSVIHMPETLWVRHKIAAQLQKIKKTIKEMPERIKRYDVDQSNTSIPRSDINWKQRQREACLFAKEDELVGIDNDKKMLISWHTDGYSNQMLISVLGMGGFGQTTLAAKTYSNDTVTGYLNCYTWSTFSQTYILEDLFKRLIKDFHQSDKDQVLTDLDAMNHVSRVPDFIRRGEGLTVFRLLHRNPEIIAFKKPKSNDLNAKFQVIHTIMTHTILSRDGHGDHVSCMDLYMLKKVVNLKKLNMNYVILGHMYKIFNNPAKSLPFNWSIQRIVERSGIPVLDEESRIQENVVDVYNKLKIDRMRISKVGGNWACMTLSKSTSKTRAIVYQPPAPPVVRPQAPSVVQPQASSEKQPPSLLVLHLEDDTQQQMIMPPPQSSHFTSMPEELVCWMHRMKEQVEDQHQMVLDRVRMIEDRLLMMEEHHKMELYKMQIMEDQSEKRHQELLAELQRMWWRASPSASSLIASQATPRAASRAAPQAASRAAPQAASRAASPTSSFATKLTKCWKFL